MWGTKSRWREGGACSEVGAEGRHRSWRACLLLFPNWDKTLIASRNHIRFYFLADLEM